MSGELKRGTVLDDQAAEFLNKVGARTNSVVNDT
jgi:hypothetical protein